MKTYIPPQDYFDQQYPADYELFNSRMMCGGILARALSLPMRTRFKGLAEFVVCQYELNLLNQAFHAHGHSLGCVAMNSLAPFADTRLCFSGHGMGCHLPYAILRFAQEPFREMCLAVPLTWDILGAYTNFFLGDYLKRLIGTESDAAPSRSTFLQAVAHDHDCTACILTPSGWETKHVTELLMTTSHLKPNDRSEA